MADLHLVSSRDHSKQAIIQEIKEPDVKKAAFFLETIRDFLWLYLACDDHELKLKLEQLRKNRELLLNYPDRLELCDQLIKDLHAELVVRPHERYLARNLK